MRRGGYVSGGYLKHCYMRRPYLAGLAGDVPSEEADKRKVEEERKTEFLSTLAQMGCVAGILWILFSGHSGV